MFRSTKYILVLLFLLLFYHVISQNADIRLLRKINLERNTNYDNTFKFITNTKSVVTGACFTGLVACALIEKDSLTMSHAMIFCGGFLISSLGTISLKYAVNRERPYKTYPDIEKLTSGGSPSFPSGHTSEAFSTATSISLAYPKWYVIVPAAIWASAVGYSRMDLGVHYPSDVLTGAVIGCGSSFLSYWLTKKIQHKKHHVAATYTN